MARVVWEPFCSEFIMPRIIISPLLKTRLDKTFDTGSYCARIIKGPAKTVTFAQSLQTALKKPAVYSPNMAGRIGQKYVSRQRLWRLIEEPGKIVTYCQTLQFGLKKPAV
jgi:hypothetical protein